MKPSIRSQWRRRWIVAAGAAALAAAASACGAGVSGAEVPTITAEPVAGVSDFPTTPTPEPTVSVSESTTPSASASEFKRDPTDADRGRFVVAFGPDSAVDLEHVAADVDFDGIDELVFAYVDGESQQIQLALAWWDGATMYEIGAQLAGTTAQRIDRLRVADVNEDGLIEVVVFQSGSGESASLTVWQVTGREQVRAVRAIGGCHAGSNTFGVVGANMNDQDGDGSDEIYATCDDSPLPRSAWSTDRYIWREGAYRYTPNVVGG